MADTRQPPKGEQLPKAAAKKAQGGAYRVVQLPQTTARTKAPPLRHARASSRSDRPAQHDSLAAAYSSRSSRKNSERSISSGEDNSRFASHQSSHLSSPGWSSSDDEGGSSPAHALSAAPSAPHSAAHSAGPPRRSAAAGHVEQPQPAHPDEERAHSHESASTSGFHVEHRSDLYRPSKRSSPTSHAAAALHAGSTRGLTQSPSRKRDTDAHSHARSLHEAGRTSSKRHPRPSRELSPGPPKVPVADAEPLEPDTRVASLDPDREMAAESILGLWGVNLAQERTDRLDLRRAKNDQRMQLAQTLGVGRPRRDSKTNRFRSVVHMMGAVRKLQADKATRPGSAPASAYLSDSDSDDDSMDIPGALSRSMPQLPRVRDDWEARTLLPADSPEATPRTIPAVKTDARYIPSNKNALKVTVTLPASPGGKQRIADQIARTTTIMPGDEDGSADLGEQEHDSSDVWQHDFGSEADGGSGELVAPPKTVMSRIRGLRRSADQAFHTLRRAGSNAASEVATSRRSVDSSFSEIRHSAASSPGSSPHADSKRSAHSSSPMPLSSLRRSASGTPLPLPEGALAAGRRSNSGGMVPAKVFRRSLSPVVRLPKTPEERRNTNWHHLKNRLLMVMAFRQTKDRTASAASPKGRAVPASAGAARRSAAGDASKQPDDNMRPDIVDAAQREDSMHTLLQTINTNIIANRWRMKSASKALPALAPFVPRMLQEDISSLAPRYRSVARAAVMAGGGEHVPPTSDASSTMVPCMETFEGAVLIADVTGFTKLTEELSKRGTSGVELLTKCMNNYFSKVVDLVLAYNGDVMKFAGDSVIVAFAPRPDEEAGSEDGGLRLATLRSVHCAHDLATTLGSMRMLPTGDVTPVSVAERMKAFDQKVEEPPQPPAPEDKKWKLGINVVEGAVAFSAAGQAHRAKRLAGADSPVVNAWQGAVTALSGGSPNWLRSKSSNSMVDNESASAPDLLKAQMGSPLRPVQNNSVDNLGSPDGRTPGSQGEGGESSPDEEMRHNLRRARGVAVAGSHMISLLQQVNRKLHLQFDFKRSKSDNGQERGARMPSSLPESPITTPLGNVSPVRQAAQQHPNARILRSLSHLSDQSLWSPALSLSRPPPLPTTTSHAPPNASPSKHSFRVLPTSPEHEEEAPDVSASSACSIQPRPHPGMMRRTSSQSMSRLSAIQRQPVDMAQACAAGAAAAAIRSPTGSEPVSRTDSDISDGESEPASPITSFTNLEALSSAQLSAARRKSSGSSGPELAGPSERAGLGGLGHRSRHTSQQELGGEPGHRSRHTSQQEFGEPVMRAALGGIGQLEQQSMTRQSPRTSHEGVREQQSMTRQSPRTSHEGVRELSQDSFIETVSFPAASGEPTAIAAVAPAVADDVSRTPPRNATSPRASLSPSYPASAASCSSAASRSSAGESVPSNAEASLMVDDPGVFQAQRSLAPIRLAGSAAYNSQGPAPVAESADAEFGPDGFMSDDDEEDEEDGNRGSESDEPPSPAAPAPRARQEPSRWGVLKATKEMFFKKKKHAQSQGAAALPAVARNRQLSVRWGEDSATTIQAAMQSDLAVASSAPSLTSLSNQLVGSSAAMGGMIGSANASPLSRQGSHPKHHLSRKRTGGSSAGMPKHILSLKVTVGCGTVCVFHVGGYVESSSVQDNSGVPRWEFFIGDRPHAPPLDEKNMRQPIEQISTAEAFAEPGDVILSPEVVRTVVEHVEVQELKDTTAVRLLKMLGQYEMGDKSDTRAAKYASEFAALPRAVQARAVQILRMHVMDNVRQRIEAGHLDFVNEIRVCTVLFLGFPSLKKERGAGEAKDEVASVQAAVELVQKRMRHFDGSFLQFRCDEKGFLSICAFGLPGKSKENGPTRGIQAALSIVEGLKERGEEGCVGVTTGQLLCACVGSRIRAEYTVFGDAINLSARLMCKSKAGLGEVLCDYTTYMLAKRAATYTRLEPLTVKGRSIPLDVYRVSAARENNDAQSYAMQWLQHKGPQRKRQGRRGSLTNGEAGEGSASSVASGRRQAYVHNAKPMIGRQEALNEVTERICALVEQDRGGLVLIEGEAGMGKTRLLEELQRSDFGGVRAQCVAVFASGETQHKSQVLFPWRRIFRELFNHDRLEGQLYSLRQKDAFDRHPTITKLGKSCKEAIAEYATLRTLLSQTLEIPEDELPVAPPNFVASAATKERAMQLLLGAQHASWLCTQFERRSQKPPVLAQHAQRYLATRARRKHGVVLHIKRPATAGGVSLARRTGSGLGNSAGLSVTVPRALASAQTSGSSGPMPMPPTPTARAGKLAAQKSSIDPATTLSKLHGQKSSLDPAPTLGAGTGRKDAELTRDMKAQRVQEALIQIMTLFVTAYGKLVIMLEDLHHYDTTSWQLLASIAESLHEDVVVVATMRPSEGGPALSARLPTGKELIHQKVLTSLQVVQNLPTTTRVELLPFTLEQTQEFVSVALDGAYVSRDVAQAVWEKTSGLPLYIEQMVVYLQQQQLLSDDAGTPGADITSLLGAGAGLSSFIRNTVTIHSVITDRIDKLRPSQQLTLKVGSVMGMTVSLELLHAIHPMATAKEALEHDLQVLTAANFLRPDDDPATNSWIFCQVLGRDVAYELIPFSQRRNLHARLAEALEKQSSAIAVPSSTIAYHWTQSCAGTEIAEWRRAMRAIAYWEKSAQECMDEGIDYTQALRWWQKADLIADQITTYFRKHNKMSMWMLSNQSGSSHGGHLGTDVASDPDSPTAESNRGGVSWENDEGPAGSKQPRRHQSPIIDPVRRARFQRGMAGCCLERGELDLARSHGLQALHLLGAPRPSDGQPPAHRSCLCLPLSCLCGGSVTDDAVSPRRGDHLQTMSSAASATTPRGTWADASNRLSATSLMSMESLGRLECASLEERKEAAAVLQLLVTASLRLSIPDVEALHYIRRTALWFEGLSERNNRMPENSPLQEVVQSVRVALRIHQPGSPSRFSIAGLASFNGSYRNSKDMARDPGRNSISGPREGGRPSISVPRQLGLEPNRVHPA